MLYVSNESERSFPQHCILSSTTLHTRSLPLNFNSQRKDAVLKTLNIKKLSNPAEKFIFNKNSAFSKFYFWNQFHGYILYLHILIYTDQGKNTAGISKSDTPHSHLKTLSFRSPSQIVRSLHNLRTVNYMGVHCVSSLMKTKYIYSKNFDYWGSSWDGKIILLILFE